MSARSRRTLLWLSLTALAVTPMLLGSDCDTDSGGVVDIINAIADAVIRIINQF